MVLQRYLCHNITMINQEHKNDFNSCCFFFIENGHFDAKVIIPTNY